MNTSPRSPKFTIPVIRHFEFTRLQDQLMARTYQVLIPAVSRPLVRTRPGCNPPPTIESFQSKARGA